MNFEDCCWEDLTERTAQQISLWEYDKPLDVYSLKGRPNGYLFCKDTWGVEQFCLTEETRVIGLVACQYEDENLWVGWSLAPALCGKGLGHLFILKCIKEIRKEKAYDGPIYLRVAASNKRAVRTYLKAGFCHVQTITDEVAYTNHREEFWVMMEQNAS